ncbi:MAG: radical SAM family heme chaperone HemW [Leptospiraceae bacterium]|nr:radical SAM family heme chaperone HemW [Leptospiraceae bacterium]
MNNSFQVRKKREGYLGIYIHYPYCYHKCSYCDFYSIGIQDNKLDSEEILFESYRKEILLRVQENPELNELLVDTIFFGGGTPSKASPEKIRDLILFLRANLKFDNSVEISLEANPENIDSEYLERIHDAGINRLNVGIQSFQPKHLISLDRYFDSVQYEMVMERISSSKISNIGIDLIFGIPNQTKEEFYEDVSKALDYRINHISLYSLTVEKGTEYSRKVSEKLSKPPEEELQVELLNDLPKFLQEYNFYRYEISNYSKQDSESKHNLRYWMMENYIGIGPGAHGFLPKGRYSNPRNIDSYLKEKFGRKYQESNFVIETSLNIFRLTSKIDLFSFFPNHKLTIQKIIEKFKSRGLCEFEQGVFQWKTDAILYLDSHIEEIVMELGD